MSLTIATVLVLCDYVQVRQCNERSLENTLIPSLDSVFWIYPDWWSLIYLQLGSHLTAQHITNGKLQNSKCSAVCQSFNRKHIDTQFLSRVLLRNMPRISEA